jgi:hypothetical protein
MFSLGRWVNSLLVLASVLLATVLAEGATRLIDGLPLFTDWLPSTVDRDLPARFVDALPRAPGVERNWFFRDPPPLPNRRQPPAEWLRLAASMGEKTGWAAPLFHHADFFKAWNEVAIGNPCDHPVLRQAPGRLFVYTPADGSRFPRFRFLPDATTPLGLVTNRMGWRGPAIALAKPARTVRIAFVGASTTVNSHFYPFSYPELVGGWLNLWAAAHKADLRFEIINAGREGMTSADIEAIVRTEVVPFRPDLVVYYEGANQFFLGTMVKALPEAKPVPPRGTVEEGTVSRWLRDASQRSAMARRLQAAMGMVGHPGHGGEWTKPDYELGWPAGLSEDDPDIGQSDLPLHLSEIVADLDHMRVDLAPIGAELAMSSFKWLVHDGMVVDPVRNRSLIEHLNVGLFPFRYRDLERMSAFQNRVLAKYAAERGLPFIDVASRLPDDEDLYTDGVHLTYGGVRLHAWIVLQALVPLIDRRLADRVWPVPFAPEPAPPGPFITPREIPVACTAP